MAQATLKAKTDKTGATFTAETDGSPFGAGKFEFPKFDIPSVEVPAAYRELAEKSVAQAKQGYEKMKAVTEEATDVMEAAYATASKGAADYGLQLIEAFRANANANFDFARDLFAVKSLSEAVELSTAHTRKQFEAMTAQTKDLAALAQKVTTETAEPLKQGVTKAFRAAA
jgi:phasin